MNAKTVPQMTTTTSFLRRAALTGLSMLAFIQCERSTDGLSVPSHPAIPDVFLDGFSAGLNYAAFGGSVPAAFQVDAEVAYGGSAASMRFEVPDVNDPRGAYAGGVFFTSSPRDLSGFDALTMWIKASQAVDLDLLGFGNDLGVNRYQASIAAVPVNTHWKKVIIPIPDASLLTAERGMFFYSVGPVGGKGFTFWIDEVKFEKLGTIAHAQPVILGGQDLVQSTFAGVAARVTGLSSVHNLPNGLNQAVNVTPEYFEFQTTNASVATVDAQGNVSIVGGPATSAVITATMGGREADGSLTIQSQGPFQHAPTPTRDAAKVISVFSDAYFNVPVAYYNGYWAPFQTTQSADFAVNGDNVLQYTLFNFVGIEFASHINGTAMTHLHVDVFIPHTLTANARVRFEMVGGSGTGTGTFTRTFTPAEANTWVSLDIPLASFAGLNSRASLFQIVFVDVDNAIDRFFADNIYFYQP